MSESDDDRERRLDTYFEDCFRAIKVLEERGHEDLATAVSVANLLFDVYRLSATVATARRSGLDDAEIDAILREEGLRFPRAGRARRR